MNFTKDRADRLRTRYVQAVENGEESFLFDGQELLTAYAKYLLEFLKMNGL
jgi:hypothetical protein